MRKRTIVGTLLTIAVTLLLTGLPAVAADDDPTIDYIYIKPCKDPNVLNVNVIGWLPVAIYGDWELVNETTVMLEGVPALQWFDDKGDYLLVKFDAEAVIDTFDDPQNGQELELCLTGEFVDAGGSFEACDNVTILKRGKR
jgi:hypothetical protein